MVGAGNAAPTAALASYAAPSSAGWQERTWPASHGENNRVPDAARSRRAAAELHRFGRTAALANDMASFAERDEVVGLSALQRLTGRLTTRH